MVSIRKVYRHPMLHCSGPYAQIKYSLAQLAETTVTQSGKRRKYTSVDIAHSTLNTDGKGKVQVTLTFSGTIGVDSREERTRRRELGMQIHAYSVQARISVVLIRSGLDAATGFEEARAGTQDMRSINDVLGGKGAAVLGAVKLAVDALSGV